MIELNNISKTYRSLFGRQVQAVEGFSLQVADGEVLGIAGPNGAGKSTLIALLLGYLRPTSGSITIHGQTPRAYVETHGIGYVSELVKIHPRWRLTNALVRYATLAGVPSTEVSTRVEEVIDRLGLGEHRNKSFKALSKGNAQRLGLAQALLRDERVMILDEPTHGLDPLWTQRFRDIVNDLRRSDRIIIIASHNLDELQRLTDRVVIVDHGRLQRLVRTGFMGEQLTARVAYTLQLANTNIDGGDEHIVAVFPDVVSAGKGEFTVSVDGIEQLNQKLMELMQRGVLIAGVMPTRSALEEHFREAVGNNG